jgi:LCP family protein required for cell wall assembly
VSDREPVTQSDARRHRLLRRGAAAAAVLTLVATTASGAGWVALNRLTSNISTVDVSADLGTDRPVKVTPAQPQDYEPLTVLVMGTDTRTGQGSGFGDPSQTAEGLGHSDTTIVLHISGDRTRALGVSIPRDSWVTRPLCGSKTGSTEGKFNEAFAAGGPACTIKAVEKLTGVRIDHFVVVDFKGFKAVVDALDGVPICLKEAVDDAKSGLKLSAGTHVLDGDQALAFARARKTLGDGSDISRIDRQQVFLSSVVRKATSQNVLTDLPTLYSVLDAVTKSLTTDPGLGSLDALKTLALSLQGVSPSKVQFVTVPWVARSDGANVLWATSKADVIWQSMKDDTPWPPTATVPAGEKPLTVKASDIRVRVLNGSGVSGRGSAAAAELTKLGFVVTGVATAPKQSALTTVTYDPKYAEASRTLAYAAKTTNTTATGTGTGRTLTLVVGSDWTGTRGVTVASGSGTTSNPTVKPADQETCVG